MNIARLARIPERCKRDVRLILMLENWREALHSELTGAPLKKVKLRNGTLLTAPDTLSLAFLFHEIWMRRTYTPPRYEIKAGDVVIDIGGNIGVFAAYAATAAPDVRVYSYEPFPGNIEWLRRNIEQSKLANVRIIEQAVGAQSGQRTLHVNPESWIVHSLVREEGSSAQDISVECVSLDQVFADNKIETCDLLKLDCEGSEYEILMGCRPETLRRVRRIVGEYHEGENIGRTGEELRRFLESLAFRVDSLTRLDVDSGIFYATNTAI